MALNANIENLCKELQMPTLGAIDHKLANCAAKEGWKLKKIFL